MTTTATFGLDVARLRARRSGFVFSDATDVTEDSALGMLQEAEGEVVGFLLGRGVPLSSLENTSSYVHSTGRGWALDLAANNAAYAVGMLTTEAWVAASDAIRERMENYRRNPADLGTDTPTGDDAPGVLLTNVSQRTTIQQNRDTLSDRLHRRNRQAGRYE